MYESPLTKITMMCDDIADQIIKQEEDKIVYEVRQAIGYNIDKQELVKALQYDRGQYQKGYADAMAVIDDIKAEIQRLKPNNLRPEQMTDYDYAMAEVFYDILSIIDNHIGKENNAN